MKNHNFILASGSPRRKELLEKLEITFDVQIPDVPEEFDTNLSIDENLLAISLSKAKVIFEKYYEPDLIVLSGDTVVQIDENILGKPQTKDEAIKMLQSLSGRTHLVKTAFCIISDLAITQKVCVTEVTFKPLTDQEIHHYIHLYSPMDKAGAYGIQDWIGYIGIESIVGDYYNVMGFPIAEIYKTLQAHF